MSGRSIGLAATTFAGVRVSSTPTYIPAHINAGGKRISAKITIPVAKNSHKGTNQKDGSAGRTDFFTLTAWGKLADIMARSCPPGKALDCVCEPRSYMGKLFNSDGSLKLDSAGQPIMVPKTSFNIVLSPVFGEESQGQIDKEINAGLRPGNWNIKGHPDYELWTSILKQRQTYNWDGQSPTFLFARVVVPQNVQLDFSQNTQQPAAVQPLAAAPTATVPSMVNHAVMTTPVQPVQTPATNINSVVVPTAPIAPGAAAVPANPLGTVPTMVSATNCVI